MAKGLGDMMKQLQKMQVKMAEMQGELEQMKVEGSSGGGMVKATLNGKQELLEIHIDPEVIDKDEKEMLEELVVAAVTAAREKAVELQQEKMSELTGGLPIPGMGGGLPF